MNRSTFLIIGLLIFSLNTTVLAQLTRTSNPQTFYIASQADYESIRTDFVFAPGDNILFLRNSSFAGGFTPKGSGDNTASIVMDAYGVGNIPLIDGEWTWQTGADWGTLFFNNNNQYWEINNLRIKNGNISGHRNGIFFSGDTATTILKHIYIQNCIIDSVGGWGIKIASGETFDDWKTFTGGGTANTQYDDILIKVNTIRNSAHRSISVTNAYCILPGLGYTNLYGDTYYSNINKWSTNIVIDSNYIEDSVLDGIVVWGAHGPKITRNEINRAGNGGSGHSMFIAFTKDAIIEFNEAYNTVYNTGDKDAGGIDLDHFTFNTLCQYNYIHDNDENGIVIIGSNYNDSTGVYNSIIRYNISANNANSLSSARYSGDVQILVEIFRKRSRHVW